MKFTDEIQIKNNVFLGKAESQVSIMVVDFLFKPIDKKHIEILNISVDGKASSLIKIKIDSAIDPIVTLFKTIENFEDLEIVLSLLSPKSLVSYTKLRGDFAEALFIVSYGGEKITGELKYDIQLNKNAYEIKSYTKSNGVVTIKNSQIESSINILGVELQISNEGKTIIELADTLTDKRFSDYLYRKYENTDLGTLKFSSSGFNYLNPTKIVQLPSIRDMSIEFFIKDIIGGKYE